MLCIPDLTGFTRFISDTDIAFSGKVVPSVLKAIIHSNQSRYHIGEVEGDAVLFYAFEPFPELSKIYDQCMQFFKSFRDALDQIEKEFPEESSRYLKGNKLGLKVILHSGLTFPEKIDTRTKLIGEDVIKAHKLLKNSVKEDEYILCSENFLSQYSEKEITTSFFGNQMIKGRDYYEHIGMIPYRYVPVKSSDSRSCGTI